MSNCVNEGMWAWTTLVLFSLWVMAGVFEAAKFWWMQPKWTEEGE